MRKICVDFDFTDSYRWLTCNLKINQKKIHFWLNLELKNVGSDVQCAPFSSWMAWDIECLCKVFGYFMANERWEWERVEWQSVHKRWANVKSYGREKPWQFLEIFWKASFGCYYGWTLRRLTGSVWRSLTILNIEMPKTWKADADDNNEDFSWQIEQKQKTLQLFCYIISSFIAWRFSPPSSTWWHFSVFTHKKNLEQRLSIVA